MIRGKLWSVVAGLLMSAAILGPIAVVAPSARAAAGKPEWSVAARALPTVLSRPSELSSPINQQYEIVVTNLGEARSEGTFTITDTLPPGVQPSATRSVEGANFIYSPLGYEPLDCSVAGQVISCEGSEPIPPGEAASVNIPVEVEAGAAAELTDLVEVTGGNGSSTRVQTTSKVGSPVPSYGFLEGPSGLVPKLSGPSAPQAASHPYAATFALEFPLKVTDEELHPVAEPKEVDVTLPRGMYANPAATVKCTETEFETEVGGVGCRRAAQVGVATFYTNSFNVTPVSFVRPIYNLVAPPGYPAEFGFEGEGGLYVHMLGHVRSSGEYELAAMVSDTPAKLFIVSATVSLWGSPTDVSHDEMRGQTLANGGEPGKLGCIGRPGATCPTERLSKAFLTLPSDCSGHPLSVFGETASWVAPSVFDRRGAAFTDLDGNPVATTACASVPFSPTISTRPIAAESGGNPNADSPAGLDFDLHQSQDENYDERATANLKDAEVVLPVGLAINPSGANGLGACTESEIGRLPAFQEDLRFSEEPQTCPNSSKIGTVSVSTPLLDHELPGAIYVATPFENPFGSLVAIYLAVEDEASGIVSKLAGKVTPDPKTGQLTATFTNNPELPLEDIELHFFAGNTAALKTSLTCGTYTATSTLVPWSSPEGATAHPTDSFATVSPASGSGACPTSEAAAPFAPSFVAGTVNPSAGAYSQFVLRVARNDGERQITGIDTALPRGLLGKLAGIPYCSEAQIAAARAREAPQMGALEAPASSCPAASEVGTVTIGAGAGADPYYVTGHAYLSGPYQGAPLSLVIITPAVAGPFDLGDVVTRVALHVDPFSTQIDAVSDPLPTILDGIPLDIRSIVLRVDRPNFILNPTSCQEKRITGSASSQAGGTAVLLNRFQVGQCNKLKFKPTLKLSLNGSTKRTGHPALKAVLTYPKKGAYANIARAQVNLPHAEFLDQNNLNKTCTRPVLLEGKCPKSTIYGKAKAWSPLLARPLEGPVYLVGGFGYKLPALIAELNGQIRVLLKGKVDSGPNHGIRTTFEAVPDAPVSRFVLQLKGGPKYSLLESSEDLCRRAQVAKSRFTAQNGIVAAGGVTISRRCSARHPR